jgi:hypothetical protein
MQQRQGQRAVVKGGLMVALVGIVAFGCVGLTPASSAEPSLPGAAIVPAQSGPTPGTIVDVTTGPSKTKKPKRTPAPETADNSTGEPTTQPTDTGSATDQPTSAPSDSGLHLHSFVLASFVLASLIIQEPPPRLDYSASASYGEANLGVAFAPDPYSVGMTTGGPVDVSYLGGSCSGFATTNPDLRVNFGGGTASLLRIYFVGTNDDAAMVVNDPYGNFYCVDDSFGTVNPTIDFNNPAGGSYEIWIARSTSAANVSGTVYLTENSSNHP